jgi:hypothetical protein
MIKFLQPPSPESRAIAACVSPYVSWLLTKSYPATGNGILRWRTYENSNRSARTLSRL